MYNTLLCYPPLHYCWGRCGPFFYTVAGAILYCATPPYATVGADAARFFVLYGCRRNPLLCYPPTLLLRQMLPVFYTVGCAILYCATPPTLLLGDPLLRYPPTLYLGQILPVFVR